MCLSQRVGTVQGEEASLHRQRRDNGRVGVKYILVLDVRHVKILDFNKAVLYN
jgi:hypothetical protein